MTAAAGFMAGPGLYGYHKGCLSMREQGIVSPSSSSAHEQVTVPENLPDILKTGHTRLLSLGPQYAGHAERLDELNTRLSQGRFHLAVLGQVKRGKSTFLNALLGESVLPAAVVPLTAIPTFIRFGPELSIRVRYLDNRPDTVMKGEPLTWLQTNLEGFVTEKNNPKNTKCVRDVEITHPAPILRDVVLIDTPGIGSTFRHNTEITMNFLPQCDAALFMVSADPPITELEVAFLRHIGSRVGQLFFVLNKVDYLDDEERETAVSFYRRVLEEEAGIASGSRIFPVSARKGLLSHDAGNARLWEESGLEEVMDHLIAFLAHEKNRAHKEAIGRKTRDILYDALLQIDLEIRALELPLADLESRLFRLDRIIEDAGRQRMYARDILAGDKQRIVARVEEEITRLRIPFHSQLTAIAGAAITASFGGPESAARDAVAKAIPAWFERELGRFTQMADGEVAGRLKEHQGRADDLIKSVRNAAAELFEIPCHAPEGENVYRLVQKPYWVGHAWDSTFTPVPAATLERLLPGPLRERRARSRMKHQIDTLVTRNLENIRYETLRSIDEAFRKFGADLDFNLQLTTDATHGAAHAVFEKRTQHAGLSAGRLEVLRRAKREIAEAASRFSQKYPAEVR